MPKSSSLTDAEAVRQALAEYDRLGQAAFLDRYGFRPARNYMLEHNGNVYDSKAIFGAAFGYQHGVLEKLGFSVATKNLLPPARFFQRGHVYDRRAEIHSAYGGQEQGGISTPTGTSAIFLFTGESGGQFGYDDGPCIVLAST